LTLLNKKNGIKYPRMTEILRDCTYPGWAIQWGANTTADWVKECCITQGSANLTSDDLEDARFYHKEVSQQALDVGSEVHARIERYFKKCITDTK
jgi:hypothetical protein